MEEILSLPTTASTEMCVGGVALLPLAFARNSSLMNDSCNMETVFYGSDV